MSAVDSKQLRLGLPDVIQMMKSQAPDGVVIQSAEVWPPVAWVMMQAEAFGQSREVIATSFGVTMDMLAELVGELIQAPNLETAHEVWDVGVIALKVAQTQTTQVLATTWDQVEAMAIAKLADAIQNVAGANADPMKLASIAKTANSAVRRSQGEGHGRGVGGPAPTVDLELQSGDLGSIRLRLSTRVRDQMNNPNRVIDVTPNKPVGGELQMLRLKEIRPIAEALDSEADKARAAAEAQAHADAKALQEKFAPVKSRADVARETAEQFRFADLMNVDVEVFKK